MIPAFMILFLLTISIILLVALASFFLVLFGTEKTLTFTDLDRVYFPDRTYIGLAPRDAWNDPD